MRDDEDLLSEISTPIIQPENLSIETAPPADQSTMGNAVLEPGNDASATPRESTLSKAIKREAVEPEGEATAAKSKKRKKNKHKRSAEADSTNQPESSGSISINVKAEPSETPRPNLPNAQSDDYNKVS